MGMTPQQLVASWLIGNGVSISNVTFNGSSDPITSTQIGIFEANGGALAELELDAGIVMTSGTALNTVGPNETCSKSTATGTAGDPDLNIIAGVNTQNAAVLEFDFVPESDTLKFRYVFGSEEIWFYCYSFNDAFGFFLSGPGINGPFSNNAVNIALMPGSTNWVTLNNMCDFPESMWCNAPVNCPKNPPPPSYANCQDPKGSGVFLQYNGLTYVYTAWYVVTACSTYHIKLAVGDALDQALDSGVFLEKNSFSASTITVFTNFSVPSLGERAIEGCSDAIVNIVTAEPVVQPYTIYYNIGGTAINGVDYVEIPDSVVIPAGQTTATITIDPIYDGITEGVETVILEFLQPGCSGTQTITDTILIDDNTPFFVYAGPDDTICAGDSATLSGTAWGGQRPYDYSWEGVVGHDSIIKVSPPPGSYQYVLMVEEGCSVTERDTMELLVKPLPVLSVGNFTDTICSEETINIPLISSIPGSTFSWVTFNPSGNVTGHSSGTGSTISQTLVNNSFVLDSVRYTIGVTADGCSGQDTSIIIFIRPIPDLIFTPLTFELCNGQTTAIDLFSNVSSTTFSWTATCSNPNISGYSDGSGDAIQQLLMTSAQISDTVFYHVTATSNGCSSAVTDYPVVVNPVPMVTVQPMWDTICSGEFTNIQLSASCFGTSFTWTAVQGVGNVIGFSDGTGSLIDQQLINQLPTTGSVEYTITPSTSSCTGQDTLFTMWVKPTPQVTNSPPDTSICNEQSIGLILQSDVPGTLFTWNCTPGSPNVSGWADQTIPTTWIDQTLTNTGFNVEWVIYQITPAVVGCSGPVFDYTVTVFPTPDLSNTPSIHAQCNSQIVGEQPGGMVLYSNVAGATFTWQAFASSPNTTGFHDQAGPGLTLIDDTLVNSGFGIDTVTYRILPSANGCSGDSTDYRVVVFPTPDLSNPLTTQSQCNGQSTGLSLLSNVPGTLFTWTAYGSSPFVTGFSNSTSPGTLIDQTLVNSGYDVEWVTYQVTPAANGCDGDTIPFTVVVYPVADVMIVPDGDTLCSGQVTDLSVQSHVSGTSFTWSATGSSPEITGYGPGSGDQIQQTLINSGYLPGWVAYQVAPMANGCLGTPDSVVVTINPVPVVLFTACFDTITTTDAQPIWLIGGIPLNGTFSGSGVNGSQFFPGIAGPGTHTITYTYTNDFGCVDSARIAITNYQPSNFNCGDTLTDLRDSLRYPTVLIGSQCWMATNLNYGSIIASSQMQRDNCVNEKYCYNDNPANCISYGGLYQWDEVMRYRSAEGEQGLCPPGWHLPTEADWNALFLSFISSGFAGNPLKSSGYSGFNALMTGIRFHNNIWKFPANDPILRSKLYWSSNLHSPQKAWAHGMNEVVVDIEYTPSVSFYPSLRSNAFAIRCLKD